MKTRRLSLDSSSLVVEGGGVLGSGRAKTRSSEGRKTHSLEDAELEVQKHDHSLGNVNRPQTIEEEFFKRRTGPDGLITRNSFMKHNKTFHKFFPDLPAGESLTHAFNCALQKEVLYHGKLFVVQNYACFYSSVLLKETKVVISVCSVQEVKKKASPLSNRLSIITKDGGKYTFKAMRNRELCYKLLQNMCPNAQCASICSSPLPPTENGLDQEADTISSHSSLDDSLEQHLEGDDSLSSLVDTGYSDLPNGPRHVSRRSSSARSSVSRDNDDHFTEEEDTAESWVRSITERVKRIFFLPEIRNFNTLICIYLLLLVLLLLSSGYIGLKIVALDEQLSSLGSLPDSCLPHKEYTDT